MICYIISPINPVNQSKINLAISGPSSCTTVDMQIVALWETQLQSQTDWYPWGRITQIAREDWPDVSRPTMTCKEETLIISDGSMGWDVRTKGINHNYDRASSCRDVRCKKTMKCRNVPIIKSVRFPVGWMFLKFCPLFSDWLRCEWNEWNKTRPRQFHWFRKYFYSEGFEFWECLTKVFLQFWTPKDWI